MMLTCAKILLQRLRLLYPRVKSLLGNVKRTRTLYGHRRQYACVKNNNTALDGENIRK